LTTLIFFHFLLYSHLFVDYFVFLTLALSEISINFFYWC
jgi:hypothetical protein